jgi:predicted NUDIX family NTP pyrophosphohydrolase
LKKDGGRSSFGRSLTPVVPPAAICVALTIGVVAAAATSSLVYREAIVRRPLFGGPINRHTGFDAWAVATGDLNRDGRVDIVAVTVNKGEVAVLLNHGAGKLGPARLYGAKAARGSWSVAIGDVNGDQAPDLATADSDVKKATIFINRGDGSFQRSAAYTTGAGPRDIAVGDFNGDHSLDLATANEKASTVSVFINTGDGSFAARRDYGTGRDSKTNSVAIEDLNGDQRPDLATANFEDTVSIFLGRGDGTFQARRDLRAGSGPRSVSIADLNRDRRPDVVTANTGTGELVNSVSILLNKGSGNFRRLDYRVKAGLQLGFGSVAVADLNADGRPDVATGNDTDPGTDSVLINRGDGVLRGRFDFVTGRSEQAWGARTIAIADLNGDRKPELVTARDTSKSVSVLINAFGRCAVPDVRRKQLAAAREEIVQSNCRLLRVDARYSRTIKAGRVVAERPMPGTVLPKGGKVDIVVSRGPKR